MQDEQHFMEYRNAEENRHIVSTQLAYKGKIITIPQTGKRRLTSGVEFTQPGMRFLCRLHTLSLNSINVIIYSQTLAGVYKSIPCPVSPVDIDTDNNVNK